MDESDEEEKTMKKTFLLLLSVCLLISEMFYCQVVQAAPVINRETLFLMPGGNQKLEIIGTTLKVKWSSSKKSVVTVSKNGVVKAQKAGTAVITAKAGENKYYCKVTVETPRKKITYNNSVFTKKFYESIKRIECDAEDGKTKKIKDAKSIRQIYAELAGVRLQKAAEGIEPIEGGIWLTLVKKNGKKINIVVGSQVIVDVAGEGTIYFPSDTGISDKVGSLLRMYGK